MPGSNLNYVPRSLTQSISSVCVPSPTNVTIKQEPINQSVIKHKNILTAPLTATKGNTHSVLPGVTIAKVTVMSKNPIPFVPPISSRELCAFWFREGKCRKGTACRFSHGVAKKDASKVRICKHWFQGMCKYRDSCILWHPNGENSGAILKELGLINKNGAKSLQTSMSKDILALARKRAEQARKLREYEEYLEQVEKEKSKASVNDDENSKDEPNSSSSRSFSLDRKGDSTSDSSTNDERLDSKSRRKYERRRGRVRKSRKESLRRSSSKSSERRYSRSNRWSRRRRRFSDSSVISSSSEQSRDMSTGPEARRKYPKTIPKTVDASRYSDDQKQRWSTDDRSQSRRRSSRAQQRRRGRPCRKKRRTVAGESQSESRERYERYRRERSPFERAEPYRKRYERRRSNSSERRRFHESSSKKSRRF